MGDSKVFIISNIMFKDMEKALFNLWVEWFVGFCDADANFQVFPKKDLI